MNLYRVLARFLNKVCAGLAVGFQSSLRVRLCKLYVGIHGNKGSESPPLSQHNLARILIYSSLLFFLTFAVNTQADWLTEKHAIMGTEVNISVWHTDKDRAKKAVDAVVADMQRINDTYSSYDENSALSSLNQKAGLTPQSISGEMRLLLAASIRASKLTNGAFDITYASVGYLYNYREKQQPTQAQIQANKEAINYRWLDLKEDTVFFKHPNVKIDLGGIAKGYAVDRAIAILQQLGIEYASVSAGGDSRLLGDRRGRPWVIGIKNPRQDRRSPDDDIALRIPLSDAAVSTSGDYERYFIDETSQTRVHHIVNPRSGRSAQGVVSVTVIGTTGLETDPLSTGIFVMGVEKGLTLVNQLQGIDVIIIDRFGKVHYSNGLMP